MSEAFKRLKFDSVWIGAAIGLLMPVVMYFAIYLIRYNGMHMWRYFRLIKSGDYGFPLSTICLLPDLCLFFIFLWLHRERTSRGILMAIFPFVIYMVWKFSA